MSLDDSAAIIADHELRALMPMPCLAGYVSVQAFNPVNKAVFLPKLNRAVHCWRFRIFDLFCKIFQYFISAEGLGPTGDNSENLQPWLRKPVLMFRAVVQCVF